ncbi:MAG TPA: hypothetical protein VG759_15670 [Candidatus Angelobacter sp.]|jgi:hypothetical protein|nr:hypothetical protein [Candidatus Angelobacter sp.]
MREIVDFPKFRRQILAADTIHIMAVGFEQRCLAYPKILHGSTAKEQTFLAIKVSGHNISQNLIGQSEQNEADIRKLLPSIHIQSKISILEELRVRAVPTNYCIDTSSMPRAYIRDVLAELLKRSIPGASIFVTYSYPARFVYGNLQEPASDVATYFDTPVLVNGKKVAALIMPGFDIDYTNMALTHLTAATGLLPAIRWLFSFPGRKYQFYERALETHIDMMDGKGPIFFPQDEIAVAMQRLYNEITAIRDMPVFCIPLGSRLTCVPLFLAVWRARMEGKEVNVLIPKTRRYNSLRSEGGGTPLIEQLQGIDGIKPA